MKPGKLMILALTFLLSAIAVAFGANEIGSRNFPFSVIVTSDGYQEEIQCMKLRNEYYIFVPSYGTEENARIKTNLIYDVSIDGKPLKKGQSCEDFPVNTKLELYFRSYKNEGCETITFVRSDNVATVYIDVPSGSMEYIHQEKGNAEPGRIRIYREDGSLNYAGSLETIKGRGNATWEETEKKSYSLELHQSADLLGMGNAQRWILLSNVWDSSHIRNKTVYDAAQKAGMAYTPGTNWIDLYLNGKYAGLYLLSERNEIHPERVNISPETGFLVSLEVPGRLITQGYPFVTTQNGLALRIHHSSLSESELTTLWQSVENAILAEDGIDPISGKSWLELIDLDSWAHKYLLEELFGNYDAGSVSQYFYCDLSKPGPKIYAGPIWDFDNSMGRGGWITNNPQSFLANRRHFFGKEDEPLFYGLYQKKQFYDRVVELFETIYEPMLMELLTEKIGAYETLILQAQTADGQRWETYDNQVMQRIRTFLGERLAFFHDLWINQTEYCTVEITVDYSTWGCYVVEKGNYLKGLPGEDSDEWYHAETGELFDRNQPIVQDISICRYPT